MSGFSKKKYDNWTKTLGFRYVPIRPVTSNYVTITSNYVTSKKNLTCLEKKPDKNLKTDPLKNVRKAIKTAKIC